MMKLTFMASNALLLFGFCISCSSPKPLGNDVPVDLPGAPKFESHYTSADSIKRALSQPGGQITLTFEYQGSLIARKRHNVDQARAVAFAANSSQLSGQQFQFLIGGDAPTSTHIAALSQMLQQQGLKPHQYHIQRQGSVVGSPVISNLKAVKTPVVMKRY